MIIIGMDIKKTFREAILEHQAISELTFKPFDSNEDDDGFGVKAYMNNKEVGSIVGQIMYDAYEYDLDDVMSEEEFDDLFGDEQLIKLDYVEVSEKFAGVGSQLVQRFLYNYDKQGYGKYYLNASPMGFDGLNLQDLIMFYRKFGFEVLKHQGNNAMMVRIK